MVNKSAGFIFLALTWFASIASAAEKPLVIVFPLEGLSTAASLQWLGEGIAESVSDQLEGREIKSMGRSERAKLVENLDLPPGAPLSRASMIRVAQRAGADMIIVGAYSGKEQNLKVSLRALNIKTLKLSGEMVANGPVSALPQMENELAWLVLINNGFDKSFSREKFQERIRKIPNPAYASYLRSFEGSNEAEQLRQLQNAVQSYRDFPEAQFRLGRIYFRKGNCAGAATHLQLGRNAKGTQVEGDFMRGTCYLQNDQPLQAIQSFWRLLQISRPYEALNNIGVAYLRKGDLALASNSLQEAKTLARTDPTVSLNLALVKHMQANDPGARAILEEACRSHSDNGMLHFLLGMILKAQGEAEKSVAALGKAKSLGTHIEKLQAEDPPQWSRALSNLENR